jgi:hypothetical protein
MSLLPKYVGPLVLDPGGQTAGSFTAGCGPVPARKASTAGQSAALRTSFHTATALALLAAT